MKRLNGFLKILADSALIAIGMLAAACAAPTAFKIPFDRSIMILGCVLGAILLSAWMHLPRIGIIPGLIFLAGTVLFAWFRREELDFAFRAVLHILLEPLSQDYPSLPTVAMPTVPHGVASLYTRDAVTTCLLIVAAVVGMLLAFSLVRGRSAARAVDGDPAFDLCRRRAARHTPPKERIPAPRTVFDGRSAAAACACNAGARDLAAEPVYTDPV